MRGAGPANGDTIAAQQWTVGSSVYTQLRDGLPTSIKLEARAPRRWHWPVGVGLNVLFLGLTSLFTDISSEMVSTVLPLYLVFHLGFTPFEFGILDGLYQGVAALVRVISGLVADRWRRHKEVAAFGYGLSAACKLGLLAVGGAWAGLASMVLLDRVGKGVRTAPRDALISLSTRSAHLGAAFGVHRALDTAGALIGPLVAFGLLVLVPDGFDAVFVASFCAALIGLGVLTLFVENRPIPHARRDGRRVSFRSAVQLLGAPRFRVLVIAGSALGLATVSDGFLYLGLQRRLGLTESLFPLLFVVTALVYFILAVPAGRLADRIGRARVFLGGYALLPLVYLTLLLPTVGYLELFACLLLFGAYYAATDGVLMALASVVLPPDLRSSGLALLTTATGLARLLASVLLGALWSWWSMEIAVLIFVVGVVVGVSLVGGAVVRLEGSVGHEPAN
jgi:MFS family permease